MKQEVFRSIEKSISSARLSTYRNHRTSNNTLLIANYVLNAKVSENFYFLLQNLEVTLRNAIYDAFKKHYPSDDFFYLYETNSRGRHTRQEIHDYGCWRMLCAVKYKLRNEVHLHDGKIIAELNFGFWTKLLLSTDNRYTNIWRRIFNDVFPYYDTVHSIDRDKPIVGQKIDNIRIFRNRIFHYEPIFNYPNLVQIHDDIIEVLGWINKDMQELSIMFDDFQYIQEEKYFIQKQIRGNNVLAKKKRRFRGKWK